MLKAKNVILRPWAEGDLALFGGIRNDVELQLMLMSEPRPNSETQVKQWLHNKSTCEDGVFFVIAQAVDSQAIGFLQAQRVDRRNRTAYLGICIARGHQSSGLGREAMSLFEDYLEKVLSIRKVLLEVLRNNPKAIGFYERIGFTVVGTLRAHHLLNGRFEDVVLFEKFLISETTI